MGLTHPAARGEHSHRLTPSAAGERIELIDAIRGFALYGVLLANLIWLSQEGAVVPARVAALPTAPLDRLVKYGVEFLVDWKFYTLFSFLFGLGFSVQLVRGERRGASILPLYARRLAVLFGIGLVHAYLLWYGDILHHYALLGFILILVRSWSDRALLGMGIGLSVLIPAAMVIGKALIHSESPEAGPDPGELQLLEARFRAFTSGDYLVSLQENTKYALSFWTSGFALQFLPAILGKFFLGFYAGRRRLLQQPEAHLDLFRRLCVWGLVVGLIGNAVWVWTTALTHSGRLAESSNWVLAAQLPIYLGVLALAAFYLSGLVLLWRKEAWRSRLGLLVPVGRMALTNYLTHSLIYLAVFYGFGLALLGRVGAAFCLALSIAIFGAQIVFSSWWLRRFQFGPAEWIWRSLTYGSRQPMRLRSVRSAIISLALLAVPLRSAAIAQSQGYPTTRRDSVVADYHGIKVADPYRWLERLDDPATKAWIESQSRLTRERLDRLPGRDAIGRRLEALWSSSRTEVPWREAGRLFYLENPGGRPQPVLYARRGIGAPPVVVLDPQKISPDGSIAVSDFAVSPDGRWLSYSASPGGADAGETHVRDLSTGRDRPDVVRGTWSTACWTFDGGGFFYMRPPAAQPGAKAEAARVEKQLWYHRLGRPQSADILLRRWTDNYRWLYCMLSDDGRWAFAVAERGAASWMYAMDLGRPSSPNLAAPLVPLLGDREAEHTPLGTVGDTLYVLTDLDAPRRRVIALTLLDGLKARARPVIPEGKDVIETATVAGNGLVLHYLVDVTSRLRRFTLNGRPAGEIRLPGLGAVEWPLNGRASAPELLYAFTSFLTPTTVFYDDLSSGATAPFQPPQVSFDPAAYETRQVFYRSNDGTRVPMFITARKGLKLDGSHPVLLTGYGGFGTVRQPSYEPQVAWWLEAGGIYAVANIRGGGEYGEAWHLAGNLQRKQQSFDDFIAAAEYLVREGYTSPQRLAIYGHSNGGLLIGAVLTQRPDLFAVAVANAGHYDMLRFHKFTVGAGWIPEYGSPDDPVAFRWLRAYSPLHHVRAGVCYPATLLLTGDHDDRVVPSHAYKFAATLQAAQACNRPILLRVASDASHGYAAASGAIAEWTDVWAFVAAQMGVVRATH